MDYLLDINKSLNIVLRNQFNALKNQGDIAQNVKYADWLALNNIIAEPPISKRIKDLVFEYYAAKRKADLSSYTNADKLIDDNKPSRQAIFVKQVSIYFYYETFATGENKIFTYDAIGELHGTTKQNAMKAHKTIAGYVEVNPQLRSQIDEIRERINAAIQNNHLKIA